MFRLRVSTWLRPVLTLKSSPGAELIKIKYSYLISQLFICMVSSDCYLTFGGNSTAPNAVATLESIGNFGVEENKLIAKEVTEFIEKELGIAKDQ